MTAVLDLFGAVALLIIAAAALGVIVLWAPDISYEDLEWKYAGPAPQYLTTADGLRIHYRDQGPADAPVLVLLHGFSASLIDWDPWVEQLGERYRIIRFDLPGHGLTRAPGGYRASIEGYADIVAALTERLSAPRFVLVGSSMGGWTAWTFALRYADRLDGLVLIDAAGAQLAMPPFLMSLLRSPPAAAILRRIGGRLTVSQALKSVFIDPDVATPALIDRYADFARAPGHRDIMMFVEPGPSLDDSTEALAALKVATLVMHGQLDTLVPLSVSQSFARTIPVATLVTYPNVGHAPMQQIPARSAADLDQWLKAHTTGS